MVKHRIAIIILAAGASVRMGTPKQLLKIGSGTLVRRAACAAIDCGCRPVILVLGANAELIRPELESLEIILTLNSRWRSGMSSSIGHGLETLLEIAPETEGILLMPADQPNITSQSLGKIIQAQAESHAGLVAARFNQVLGTPAFFSREYFGELMQLEGAGGAKTLLGRHRGRLLPVDLPEAELDLDTPEDIVAFNRHKEILRSGPGADKTIAETAPTLNVRPAEIVAAGQTRRQFITHVTLAGAGVMAAPAFIQSSSGVDPVPAQQPMAEGAKTLPVTLRVNGAERRLQLDPRVTLLDALREHLQLTGSKKGCDHGQCGACTVLVNGRRINSCLALAVVHEGDEITTIEGLAKGNELHPVQQAFLEHDGFQCGYCTPGQICSAVALLKEGHAGDDAEIREWMSGNICRCGAYPNIVAAIRDAKTKTASAS
jgi:xanthine dehydrogenase YagT iron-sulfur-binding subunit